MSDVWTWATVTDDDPLAIRLDGETDPLTTPPVSLVAGLLVGDRVRVQLAGRQAIIVGRFADFSDTGWILTDPGLVMGTGWDFVAATYRIIGSVVHIYIRAEADSTHALTATTGAIANPTVCTVPAFLEMDSTGFAQALGGANSRVASATIVGDTIAIASIAGTADITSGNRVTISGSYIRGV